MSPLRAALHGLTTRGRSLLAAGSALVCCGLGFGSRDFLRAGIFLISLPLAGVCVVTRTRYRLSCTRRLEPAQVPSGRSTTVHLHLSHESRLPSGVLLMEDALPYVLGGRPRFVLDRIEPFGVRDVSYPVRADVRGRYDIGPLSVRLADPFGLVTLTRSFASIDTLLVTPQVTPLPAVRLGGAWLGGGHVLARAVAAGGTDDATTRTYRNGDDLRKVHWRSTARVGELMVRREEQPFQNRATLLLDGRLRAHRGDGPGSSYEAAVAAAASIGVALARSGFVLHLLGETGRDLVPAGMPLGEQLLLETFALVQPTRTPDLAAVGRRLQSGADGVLVAVLGTLGNDDTARLARLRVGTATCVAVLLDVERWGASHQREVEPAPGRLSAAALLAASGWRVLQLAPTATLADTWPTAGSRGRTG